LPRAECGDPRGGEIGSPEAQVEVIGIQDGFDGLIWPEKSRELQLKDVSGILRAAARSSAHQPRRPVSTTNADARCKTFPIRSFTMQKNWVSTR